MKTVKLEEVAGFVRGVTFKPTDVTNDGIGIVRTKNVQKTLDLTDVVRIPANLVKKSSQYLQPGDILISSANSWNLVGKACWIGELGEPLAIGGFVTALRPDISQIEPRYLYRWFTAPRTQALLRSFSNNTTGISNLNLKLSAQMSVPVPPKGDQQRIAEILDQADALRVKRRQTLTYLDSLTHSIFRDMFGREATRSVTPAPREPNEFGWPWVLMDEVARLATGHTPDRKREEYWNGSIPWMSLPDIRALDGREATGTTWSVTEAGIDNSSAVVLPPGTVCYSRTASVGFVTILGQHMATSQDFHNWVPGSDLNSEYLMAALRVSRPHLLGVTDGSTHKTVYQRIAKTFRILLPPRDLQDAFAARVKRVRAQRQLVQRTSDSDSELFTSLQARAFKGEL
jgi:type I restriction enzyme S subunit